ATPRKLADGAPTAEKLGWRMSIECWSFRNFTFFESVDKASRMGVKYLEMFPGQTVAKELGEVKTNQDMSPDVQKAIQAKLDEAGIKVVNFGVTGIPGDDAGRRKLFTWAKSMGIETIAAEPDPKDLPGIDKVCQEFGINVALHNHPDPSRYWNPQTVLDACKGLSPRIGACADTGHWMRSNIKPIDAIKLLEGRLVSFHFKDLNTYGKEGAHDVPWGTGKGDVIGILRELKRQGVKAVFSSEYEHNWDKSETEIAACV
ncbi:MAG: sugar phosphate isomerase/epimerase, partial [Victivallales bacterium]|nr:sugar phosphate isomerase/epimerase [Victivallales bacterium]